MEKWKLALKEFLKDYEEDDDIIGAILCGSYANDTYNEFSSIDVVLVLKDNLFYKEKGIAYKQSFLIKYDKLPIKVIKRRFKENFDNKRLMLINMFAYGKIIYDLEGEVKHLQDIALDYVDRPLDVVSNYDISLDNYYIWDNLDKLKVLLNEDSASFNIIYYNLLSMIYESYCKFTAIPIYPQDKLYKILTDNNYQEKYHVFKLPEEEFIRLYIKCYSELRKDSMYKNISNLVSYYYTKQGGFSIRLFNIRKEI